MIPTWITAKRTVVALVLLLAVALYVGSCRASDREKRAAAAAALAKEAQHTADSLAAAIMQARARARRDSADAAAARARADSATFVSNTAIAESRRLRRRLQIVSETGIVVQGDTAVVTVPRAVVEQLVQDSSTINDLEISVMRLRVAIERDTTELATERAYRQLAEMRGAALDRVNAALRVEVKALAPPRCARTCGAIVGVISTIVVMRGLRL